MSKQQFAVSLRGFEVNAMLRVTDPRSKKRIADPAGGPGRLSVGSKASDSSYLRKARRPDQSQARAFPKCTHAAAASFFFVTLFDYGGSNPRDPENIREISKMNPVCENEMSFAEENVQNAKTIFRWLKSRFFPPKESFLAGG